MSSPQQPFSSHQLRQINDLTRLSTHPGNLDYQTYSHYLSILGHVRPNHNSAGLNAPMIPQNSNLQSNEGDRSDNKTDFRADQALWNQDNLPEILYIFDKPSMWLEKHQLKEPPMKTYNVYGRKLRDIPILPDHISSKVEGWRVEAWMRFDPRVSLMDFIERMPPGMRPVSKSVIQMRTLRFREDCAVLGWVAMGKNYDVRKQDLLQEMVYSGIDPNNNSTRGMSWGLKSVAMGEAGGRIEIPLNRRLDDTVDTDVPPHLNPVPTGIAKAAASQSPASSSPLSELSIVKPENYNNDDIFFDQVIRNREANQHLNLKAPSDYFNHKDNQTPNHHPPALRTPPKTPTPLPKQPIPPSTPLRRIHLQPQSPVPAPVTPPAQITTVIYHGTPLTLKTPYQRRRDAARIATLVNEWYPPGSEGRRLQLSYLLDPARLHRGFVDNRGYWPPVQVDGEGAECIDADIVYG